MKANKKPPLKAGDLSTRRFYYLSLVIRESRSPAPEARERPLGLDDDIEAGHTLDTGRCLEQAEGWESQARRQYLHAAANAAGLRDLLKFLKLHTPPRSEPKDKKGGPF